MLLYTAADMKRTEAAADALGHSYAAMMGLAGEGAADLILKENELAGRPCLVFCGRGNNGGDGYVVANRLLLEGAKVTAVAVDGPPVTPHARERYDLAAANGLPTVDWQDPALPRLCEEAAVVVDALCGTGFSGELRESAARCCALMNQAPGTLYALDLPTGVGSDDGTAAAGSVGADVTIAFHGCKPGHLALPGRTLCGRVELVSIGIPRRADLPSEHHIHVDREYILSRIPPRPEECNKGTFGRLLAVVGGKQYMGAALLAARGALRSGVGYLQLAAVAEICPVLLPSVPECIMTPCAAGEEGCIGTANLPLLLQQAQRATALLLGCGLGGSEEAGRLTRALLEQTDLPLVLDADGINHAARCIDSIKNRRAETVLTPHPAEFARLLGLPLAQVLADRTELGRRFAAENGVTLLLKGSCTTVFTPDGLCRYIDSGSPALAKAGSGDVLAGLVGGLLAQGLAPADAAACGAWLHGRAGTLAARRCSVAAALPTDVAEALCQAFLECGR